MNRLQFFLFLFFVTNISHGFDYRMYNLTIEKGLPQSSVLCIHQDQQGFIWLGTFDGVSRFDGKNLTNFVAETDNNYSLNNSTVYNICSDDYDNLYFATYGGGLNVYNKQTEAFEYFTTTSNHDSKIVSNTLNDLYKDSKGAIWIATFDGVSKFYPETKTFENYPSSKTDTNTFPYYSALCIEEDSAGTIWFGTYGGGLCKYDETTKTFSLYKNHLGGNKSYSKNIINKVIAIDPQNLLLSTHQGVFKFHIPDASFSRYYDIDASTNYLMLDNKNDIWIATVENGLIKIDSQGNKVLIQEEPNNKNSLPENRTNTLFQDRQGNYWIGLYSLGVAYFSSNQNPFYHYYYNESGNSLIGNEIYGLAEDPNNQIWIGTLDGLSIYNPKTRIFKNLKAGTSNKTISENRIWKLFYDDAGIMWLGYANGLGKYDFASQTFKTYYHNPKDSSTIPSNEVLSFGKDRNGSIWIGCFGGLAKYNEETDSFKPYYKKGVNDSASFSYDVIWSIFSDSKDRLWIGTGKGLYQYNFKNDVFNEYRTKDTINNVLKNTEISYIHEDTDGIFWFATPKGLIRLNTENEEIILFDSKDGLPNSVIYSILEYGTDLWFSTNKGLCKLNKYTNQLATYDVSDGLQSNEFNSANLKTSNGIFIFGGINGITSFQPKTISNFIVTPSLVFTKLQLNGDLIKPFMNRNDFIPLKQPISEAKTLELSHREKLIQIEFAAIDFLSAKKIRYAYRLFPNTKKWIALGDLNTVTFTNLPPGKYRLEIRSTNNEMAWVNNSIQLNITIHSPIYKQTWFYILESMLLLVLILWYVRRRILRVKKANSKLERLVLERTEEINTQKEELETQRDRIVDQKEKIERFAKELEIKVQKRTEQYKEAKEKAEESDRLKSAFLANMSHEIRTPMNAIIGFSELLMQNGLSEQERTKYLELINSNGINLLDLLNDIIDISMIESGKIYLRIKEVNVFDIIQEVCLEFKTKRAVIEKPQIKLCYNQELLDKSIVIQTDANRLKQILYQLFDNGVKYTTKGEVGVSYKKEQDVLVFSVSDTGIGITPQQVNHIFNRFQKADDTDTNPYRGGGLGLAISKSLVEMLGGKIWVESNPGVGSTFFFSLPG